MSWTSIAAIYFILWWLVLFTVLPWGSTSPHEAGARTEEGHAASAPMNPRLLRKFAITTVVSALIFLVVYWPIEMEWISLDSIPLLPRFDRAESGG
jgi:predicted secreted protein